MTNLPLRALSVRQPWAWAIIHAGKDIENRSWQAVNHGLKVRGRICIHAAKGMTRDEYEMARDFMASLGVTCPPPADLLRGGIIGTVEVVDVVTSHESPWFFGPRACPPVINVQCVQIGPHRLYLGDAYQIVPVLTAHGPFDALAMDPPYVLATSGGGRYRKARKMLDDIEAQGLSQGFNPSILSWKYANAIVCFCSNDQLIDIVAPRLRQGFHRVVICEWHKTNPQPVANKHYRPDTEFFVHAWQKGFHPQGALADKGRYIITPVGKSPYDHPTVKPDAVMNKIVTNLAGQTICDPFMGTGSTGVAAIKQGRIFTGIELEEKYFNIACARVQAAHEEQSEDYR